jgi:hypothetical protein
VQIRRIPCHFFDTPNIAENWALSENSIVSPRASGFSPCKDGEAGDIGFIVDAAGCSQAENKPLEARSSFRTEPLYDVRATKAACQSVEFSGETVMLYRR